MFIQQLFEDEKPRQVVVTYPGRYQPFHKGHFEVFSSLQRKYGGDNVFIVTGNKTDSNKSPFNFSDKVGFMHAMGVPDHNIIETDKVYDLPAQFQSSKENIVFITVVGAPDAKRLNPGATKKDGSPSYFQELPYSSSDFQTADKHGYVIVEPEHPETVVINGVKYNASHGTDCRNLWNQVRNDPEQRAEFIQQLYGRNDSDLGHILDKIPTGAPEPAPKPSPKLKAVNKPKQEKQPKPGPQTPAAPLAEDAAGVGVVANNKQKNDPRYSTSMTQDVGPSEDKKNMKKLHLESNRGYAQGFASPTAPSLGGSRRREDDEYHVPDPVEATWYIRANGKIIKDKSGTPYQFSGKAAANKAAVTMMQKPFNAGKKFILTTKPVDDQPVAEDRTETKNEKGEVTSWRDESDWRKVSKDKNGRGKVTNLSDKARKETEKLTKKQDVAEGAEFGAYYAEQLAQKVFDQNPNLDTAGRADEYFNAAFPYMVQDLGSRKRANNLLNYDEDFPSDTVSAYAHLKAQTQGVSETTRNLGGFSVKVIASVPSGAEQEVDEAIPLDQLRAAAGSTIEPQPEVDKFLAKQRELTHRIGLTVTDPNHPMVSKRGETYHKTVRVTGPDREKAINGAIAHARRKGYRVHDHHYIGTVDQGMAEGAPELLKKEMPLHRHAEKLLAQNGVSKDDPDYHHHLNNTIKHLRQFGNIDLINKQGVAEGVMYGAEELSVGDPVVITGQGIEFEGKTGDIDSFGDMKRFVVVNLYNHGKHSFHSSDVSYNDYADQEDDLDEDLYQYDKADPYNSEFAPRAGMGRMTLRGWKESLARRISKLARELESSAKDGNIDKDYLWDNVYKKLQALNLDPIAQEIELAHQELENIRKRGGVRSRAFTQNVQ